MKVKYKSTPNQPFDYWLTPDQEYDVLEISYSQERLLYRLVAEPNGTPALHESALFEIVSGRVYSKWIFFKSPNSEYWSLTPQVWSEDNYWGRFFDLEDSAREIFYSEMEKIINENNQSP